MKKKMINNMKKNKKIWRRKKSVWINYKALDLRNKLYQITTSINPQLKPQLKNSIVRAMKIMKGQIVWTNSKTARISNRRGH